MSTIQIINCDSEEVVKAIKSIAEKVGFKDYTVEIFNLLQNGDGYYGIIKNIKIIESNQKSSLSLILKSALTVEAFRHYFPVGEWYMNECYMYETTLPYYQNLEVRNGLLPSSIAPKYYFGLTEDTEEFLIMEDLTERGYKIHNRKIPLDQAHVEMVMVELGRFHALSLALKDQEPEKFDEVTLSRKDLLKEIIISYKQLIFDDCEKAYEALDPLKDQKAMQQYKEFLEKLETIFEDIVNRPIDNYSVIIHGDFWSNNIMFKYEDKNNLLRPTKLCLIDFQFCCLKSNVFDLAYFFFGSSSKDVMLDCDHYLDIYYNSMSSYLSKLGSDPNTVYPQSVFRQEWKELAKYALFFASLLIRISLSEDHEILNVGDRNVSEVGLPNAFRYEIENKDAMNERIRNTILYLTENDLLR